MTDARYKEFASLARIDDSTDPPVLVPENQDMLAAILEKASKDSVKITVQGVGLLLSPVARTDGIVVSTRGITPPVEIDDGDFVIVAGTGERTAALSEKVERRGFSIPLDIVYGSRATVGGAFMSGRYGASAYRSKVLHDAVIGVRALTAQGTVVTGGGRTAKNVTGYDLTRFLMGTMGLYAVVFELTIKTQPLFPSRIIVQGGVAWDSLITGFGALFQLADSASLFDIRRIDDSTAIVAAGFESLGDIARRNAAQYADVLSQIGAEDIRTSAFRDYQASEDGTAGETAQAVDVTVSIPPAATATFLTRVNRDGLARPALVHPNEGKVHFKSIGSEETFAGITALSLALGGKRPVSLSAVRSSGIGSLFPPSERALVERIKRELDPGAILNSHLLNDRSF